MSRACLTLHHIEYTAADGARSFLAAGVIVEPGVIPPGELDELARLNAVKLFDPLDRDHDGKPGGSKPGRRRKAVEPTPVVEPVEPVTAEEPTSIEGVEEGLFV